MSHGVFKPEAQALIRLLVGRPACGMKQPAETAAPFQQCDAVAPFRRGQRGLKTCGAAARHNDMFRRFRFDVRKAGFLPGAGVHGAGHIAEGGAHAALVAGQAGRDGSDVSRPAFDRKAGIGNERTAHDDEVGLAFRQNGLGQCDIMDASRDGHGNAGVHGPAHGGGAVGVEAFGQAGRRDGVTVRFTRAHTDVQRVYAVVRKGAGNGQGLFQRKAGSVEFVHAQAHGNGKVGAHGVPAGFQHFQRKTQAVFLTAAVFVLSAVGEGGKKLVEKISVRAVQLDEVEPGFPRAQGGPGINVGKRVYLVACQHARPFIGGDAGNVGHQLDRAAVRLRVRRASAMLQLNADFAAAGMNGPGQPGEPGKHGVAVYAESQSVAVALPLHIGGLYHDEADASACPVRVVVEHLIGHFAVAGGILCDHGRHDKTIFYCKRINGDGRKDTIRVHAVLRWS